MAQRGGRTYERTYERTYGKSPHSTGLRPLSGPLPKNRYDDNDDDNDDDHYDDDDDDGDDNSNLSVRWFVTHLTKNAI